MSNGAEAYKNKIKGSGFQGMRRNETGRSGKEVLVWNQCPACLEIRRGPTGVSPKGNSEKQSQGASELAGAQYSLLAVSGSNQLSERRKKTHYLAI